MRKEVKQLVFKKKLDMWNNIVEKANQNFEGNKKQFWSFVGRRTKCKNGTISSLKSESGISVSRTKGKFQILQLHYQLLGTSVVVHLMTNGNQKLKRKFWIIANKT